MKLTVLAHESHELTICTPHDILHWRTVQFDNGLLLLEVIKGNGGRGTQNEACSATVEYLIGLDGGFDGFHDRVGQIPDLNQLTSENGQRRPKERTSNLLGWFSVVQRAYSLQRKWRCEQTRVCCQQRNP